MAETAAKDPPCESEPGSRGPFRGTLRLLGRSRLQSIGVTQPMDYHQLKSIVRHKTLSGAAAEQFAHIATRDVMDARKARLLQQELVAILGNVAVGYWLEPKVAEALRRRALGIIDEIERMNGHVERAQLH